MMDESESNLGGASVSGSPSLNSSSTSAMEVESTNPTVSSTTPTKRSANRRGRKRKVEPEEKKEEQQPNDQQKERSLPPSSSTITDTPSTSKHSPRATKRPSTKRQKVYFDGSKANRFSTLPDDIILRCIGDKFLFDYDAIHFAQTEHRMFRIFSQYGWKYCFDETVAEVGPGSIQSARFPSFSSSKRSSKRAPNSKIWAMGIIRNVIIRKAKRAQQFFMHAPSSVQNIWYQESLTISLNELASLPPSLVSIQPVPSELEGTPSWFVQLTKQEYEERASRQPIVMPSTIEQWFMPILFTGKSPRSKDFVEVDPTSFISCPNGLLQLETHASLYSHTIMLPDTLRSLRYGGSSSKKKSEQHWPILPPKLEFLDLTDTFDSSFDRLTSLPASLESIDFSNCEQSPIPLDSLTHSITEWPKNLTHLMLPSYFNQPIEHLSLPPTLTRLNLMQSGFDQPLENMKLPPSLTHFSCNVSHSLANLQLPSSLTSLQIGEKLDQLPLPKHLPQSLRTLRLHTLGRTDYELPNLPNLTSLMIPTCLSSTRLAALQIPPSVTELTLHCAHEETLKWVKLPPNLSKLEIVGKENEYEFLVGATDENEPFSLQFTDIPWPTTLTQLDLTSLGSGFNFNSITGHRHHR